MASQSQPPSGSKPPHRLVTTPCNSMLKITTSLNGQVYTLVSTDKAVQLAESNYPLRFYFPREAVQPPFSLVPSDRDETYCPYKGFAHYFDVLLSGKPVEQLAAAIWSYSAPFTTSDAYGVRGLLCIAAPSSQLNLTLNGSRLDENQVRAMSDSALASSPSGISSPSLPRQAMEQERRSRAAKRAHATLQPPAMKRSASAGSSAPPESYPISRPLGGELEIDSTNPVVADMIYRLDDEAQEHEHNHQHHNTSDHPDSDNAAAGAGSQEAPVDDHLLWFKHKPWYRRPSEKWLRPFALLISMAGGMCMGPKLELLNMFVCETVLGDSYVGGGDIIAPQPPTNASAMHSSLSTHSTTHWASFQPWLLDTSSASPAHAASDSDAVKQYMASLETSQSTPNSTVIPVPRRPSKACFASPEVQSSLATLQLRMTLSMGILAALTTGFWSNLSSRIGRLPVLRISMAGIIFTDLIILTAALVPRSKLPFGYSFLVLGTTLEGLLGGYSAAIAVHQSYISDVTPSGTRAHIFAHFMGIVYLGLAVGPTLGGLIVKHTDNILAPFWFALAMHLLYVLGIFTFIPESTNKDFREKARREYIESRAEIKRKADARKTAELQPLLHSRGSDGDQRPLNRRIWKRVKVAFMDSVLYAPLEPLSFLLPKKVVVADDDDEAARASGAGSPRGLAPPEASASHISVSRIPPTTRYDYNLSFLSLTYFTETAVFGIMSFKMQYAQERFIWGSAELGMYLTFLSITRVLALTFILPVAIKFLHRPVKALRLPQDGPAVEEEQTLAPDSRRQSMLDDEGRLHRATAGYGAMDDSSISEQGDTEWDETKKSVEELWTLRAKHLRLIHDSKFDLKLAKISVSVNTLSYILLVFSGTPETFFLSTAITALGGGGGAAMSSLALALLKSPADAGKLFGAWSITSAISGTVVGPILFADVFRRTTKSFPPAIFLVGAAMYLVAFVLLCCVKVRKPISLPPLPARPHPASNTDQTTAEEEAQTTVYRSSTFKNGWSLNTVKPKSASAKQRATARPAIPAFE